ncbi:MAG: hypothetical protein Q8P68_02155 [Candidatus Peregrinibacteria bacterium]|nr:hypothetical protein [Candidatus Peregrinibacteria bacterium]MDZ4245056.1 hypothetical protein [Candidatus Gracilibacteria bacterium]
MTVLSLSRRSDDSLSVVPGQRVALDRLKGVLTKICLLRRGARVIIGEVMNLLDPPNSESVVLPLDSFAGELLTIPSCVLQCREDGSVHVVSGRAFCASAPDMGGACSYSSTVKPSCYHDGHFVRRTSPSESVSRHVANGSSASVICCGGITSPLDPSQDLIEPVDLMVHGKKVRFYPDVASSTPPKL